MVNDLLVQFGKLRPSLFRCHPGSSELFCLGTGLLHDFPRLLAMLMLPSAILSNLSPQERDQAHMNAWHLRRLGGQIIRDFGQLMNAHF